jgi:hypothetical protein
VRTLSQKETLGCFAFLAAYKPVLTGNSTALSASSFTCFVESF